MRAKLGKAVCFLECVLICLWFVFVLKGEYSPFISLLFAGIALYSAKKYDLIEQWNIYEKKERFGFIIFMLIFSLITILGNYKLFYTEDGEKLYGNLIGLSASSLLLFSYLFVLLYDVFQNRISTPPLLCKRYRQNTKVIFGISFLCVTAINLAYLILVAFPGNMNSDSISQFEQIQNNSYSNHHPYYHTKLIELFYSIGMKLFAENSAAIATYTVFQIIMIGIIFSYAVTTLYEIGISKKYCYLAIASFLFYPIHWSYSSTLWKDTIWSWIVTAWLVTFFRCRKNIGNTKVNLLLLFLTSVGFCILRSNGIYAFALVLCVVLLYFFKKEKIIIYTTFTAFALSFILTRPVLAYLNVPQPFNTESLSIPIQQIARVVYDDGEITDSETALIEEIVSFEYIKACYLPHTSDAMKSIIAQFGQRDIISAKKGEFLKVWINIGMRYPFEYIKAWVDETRGYWNIDDNYNNICCENIDHNDYGIARHGLSNRAAEITSRLIKSYNTNTIMGIFVSAGALTWLYLCLSLFNIISGRTAYLEQLPLLAIVFTLLISTPVCNLFRYSYVLFTSLPFVFAIGIKPE